MINYPSIQCIGESIDEALSRYDVPKSWRWGIIIHFFKSALKTLGRIIVLFAICAVALVYAGKFFGGWQQLLSSETSTTVSLDQTGYRLTYSVSWGRGMAEKVSVNRNDGTGAVQTSGWVEIFGKPYNSGMSLYRSEDGTTFYIGQGMGFYRFSPATGEFSHACKIADYLTYTALGKAIAGSDPANSDAVVALDRGAPILMGYLDPNEGGPIQTLPPLSRYYEGARFLGKFGVTEGGVRGAGVGFVSITPEPQLGLSGRCP